MVLSQKGMTIQGLQAVSKIGIEYKFAECNEAQPQEYSGIFRGLHLEHNKEIGFYNRFEIACNIKN